MPSLLLGHPYSSTLVSKSCPPMDLFEHIIHMTILVSRAIMRHIVSSFVLSSIIVYVILLFMSSWVIFTSRLKVPWEHGEKSHCFLSIPHARHSVLIHFVCKWIWNLELSEKSKDHSFEFFNKIFLTLVT